MAIPHFFHPALTEQDTYVVLSPEEAVHASQSRRLRKGQAVKLLNGQGLVGQGELQEVDKRQVTVNVHEFVVHAKPALSLSMAVAVPKGERQRNMVDQLTQLGVTELIPVQYQYSVSKLTEKALEKWRRIAIEACKQSQNPWLPRISTPIGLENLLSKDSYQMHQKVYADAAGGTGLSYFSQTVGQGDLLLAMIGPEGGFSDDERTLFDTCNMVGLNLNAQVLRTETAAVAMAAILSLVKRR